MSGLLIFAIISITLALVFYTIGVWGEKLKKTLLKRHLVFFTLGLVFDTIGTTAMSKLAEQSTSSSLLHGITGLIAIILMLIHAIWAYVVFFKGSDEQKANFHRFSIIVWLIWLIPYFIGMYIGMM